MFFNLAVIGSNRYKISWREMIDFFKFNCISIFIRQLLFFLERKSLKLN